MLTRNRKTSGSRPYKSKEQTIRKREEHEQRVEKWQALTPKQQIAELDERFGAGNGATKQRRRINV